MKDKFIKFLVLVPGLIMLSNAIMFVLSPADVAGDLGMPLLEGIGLSTQLADLGAFFTFSALLIFYGVIYSSCLLYTSPSPRDVEESRMPSSA